MIFEHQPNIWPAAPIFESKGEKKFYSALLKAMNKNDFLICGYGFDGIRPMIDIDFLLIRPNSGALVIELKGGTVKFDEKINDWLQRKTIGWKRLRLSKQLNDEYFSFIRLVKKMPGIPPEFIIKKAIAFPDQVINDSKSKEIPRAIIIDAVDLRNLNNRLGEFLPFSSPNGLGNETLDIILENLLPVDSTADKDFGLRLFAYLELIKEQTDSKLALLNQLGRNDKIQFIGAAGTGKTWMAMDLAKKWSDQNLKVGILVTQNSLAHHIRWTSRNWENPPVWIGCKEDFRKLIVELTGIDHSSEDKILISEFLVKEPVLNWDAMIIDEAQDIKSKWFNVFQLFFLQMKKIAIFSDSTQSFGTGTGFPKMHDFMQYELMENVRSNSSIVEVSNSIAGLETKSSIPSAYVPELFLVQNTSGLDKRIEEVLENLVEMRSWQKGQIAVLYPNRGRKRSMNKFAVKPNWENLAEKDEVVQISIDGFKGLEREVVVIPLTEQDLTGPRWRNRLYATVSRASLKLIFITTETIARDVLGSAYELFDVSEY